MTDNSNKENTGFAGITSLLSDVTKLDEKKTDSNTPLKPTAEEASYLSRIDDENNEESDNESIKSSDGEGRNPVSRTKINREFEREHSPETSSGSRSGVGFAFKLILGLAGFFLFVWICGNLVQSSNQSSQLKSPSTNTARASKTDQSSKSSGSDSIRELWKLYYVTADTLNVRGGPGTNHIVIDKLKKWDEVGVLNFSNSWVQIKFKGKKGWVFGKYLQKGSGKTAYQGYCYQNAGSKPWSGEVLVRKGPTGLGELSVSNQTSTEALVRLRQIDGSARYMMYVGPWSKEPLIKLGQGVYKVQIMYGNNFSRACETFLDNAFVEVFDKKMNMHEIPNYGSIGYSSYSITLHKISGGNARTRRVDLSAFKD